MKCPVCSEEMVARDFGVNVEVCEKGCKGIWLDRGELARIEDENEGLRSAMEAALAYPRHNDKGRGQIACPRCSIPMHVHPYDRNHEVNVDECYKCGGFFLDSGELNELLDHRMTDEEVNAYADKLVQSVPEFDEAKKDLEALEQRNQAIQRYTGFMRFNFWQKKHP